MVINGKFHGDHENSMDVMMDIWIDYDKQLHGLRTPCFFVKCLDCQVKKRNSKGGSQMRRWYIGTSH